MRHLFAPIVLTAALAGCTKPPELGVADGWVRLAAAPGRPAAAYFTLTGGPADMTLLSVTSPVAIRAEMHETMAASPSAGGGGAMTMKPLAQLALPATARIAFAPGGRHVMLFDVNPVVKPGGIVPLAFVFADGSKLNYNALAVAAGAAPPTF